MQTNSARDDRRGTAYRNGVLTVIAVALVALAAQGTVGVPGPSEAEAQRDRRVDAPGGFNPADDRRVMTEELRGINARLDRILAAMGNQPFDVNVVRMPADTKPQASAEAGDGE